MSRLRTTLMVGALALLLLATGGILGIRRGGTHPVADSSAGTSPAGTTQADLLTAAIERAQQRLKAVPGDYATWAALGTAYVERARTSADPAYYPLADGALRKSLALRPADNFAAMAGLGALANSRHDFAGARDWARKVIAANPYHADAYAVLADAETQLGHASAATTAIQHLLDLRPGLPAYARAAYDVEQHGQLGEAEALLRRALSTAFDRADIAFCRYQLGELAWHQGDLAAADREYGAGLAADSDYLPLSLGMARLAVAKGDGVRAAAAYAALTQRSPSPSYLVEYAEVLRSLNRPEDAAVALSLAEAALKLLNANGGGDDLAAAQLAIAQLRYGDAVKLAGREWQRRQFADVADTLGWALHLTGRDAEALGYARRATGTGARNASFFYHQALIELSLGDRAAARRDLATTLDINPYFSPVDAPVARRALTALIAKGTSQ